LVNNFKHSIFAVSNNKLVVIKHFFIIIYNEKMKKMFNEKEYQKEYQKKYREEKRKNITEEEKEKKKQYNKEYREKNKETIKFYNKKYREENEEKVKELQKKHHEKNKKVREKKVKEKKVFDKEYFKNYYFNNKEKINLYRKNNKNKYTYSNNKSKILERLKKLRNEDPLYSLTISIRSLIFISLKNNGYKKESRTYEILGCSFEDFKIHLESQFESWMNWENKGNPKDGVFEPNKTWDIDHIIPISSAKTKEELLELSKYTNLRPLFSYHNRWVKKNNLVDK